MLPVRRTSILENIISNCEDFYAKHHLWWTAGASIILILCLALTALQAGHGWAVIFTVIPVTSIAGFWWNTSFRKYESHWDPVRSTAGGNIVRWFVFQPSLEWDGTVSVTNKFVVWLAKQISKLLHFPLTQAALAVVSLANYVSAQPGTGFVTLFLLCSSLLVPWSGWCLNLIFQPKRYDPSSSDPDLKKGESASGIILLMFLMVLFTYIVGSGPGLNTSQALWDQHPTYTSQNPIALPSPSPAIHLPSPTASTNTSNRGLVNEFYSAKSAADTLLPNCTTPGGKSGVIGLEVAADGYTLVDLEHMQAEFDANSLNMSKAVAAWNAYNQIRAPLGSNAYPTFWTCMPAS